jgi:hypothetical protein
MGGKNLGAASTLNALLMIQALTPVLNSFGERLGREKKLKHFTYVPNG